MKKKLFVLLFLISSFAHAGLTVQWANNFVSDEDDNTEFEYSKMINSFFVGASLGGREKFFLGQHVMLFSRTYTVGSSEVEISTMELGPKFLYYFTEKRSVYMSASWNPFAKGERTVSSQTYDVDGSSLMFALGWHFDVSKSFKVGLSMNYHSLSISTESLNNTETEVSESYTSMFPMIELALHFR